LGRFDSIATQIASGSGTTITFSSIPTTYRYLQLHSYFALTNNDTDITIRFNGDSGTNYTKSQFYSTGTQSGGATQGTTSARGLTSSAGPVWYGSGTSGFVSTVSYIYDSNATDKVKTQHTLTGGSVDSAGTNQGIFHRMGLWNNSTDAITSMVLTSSGGNIISGSHFALYGIKG
jgi:hypothetical protein